MAEQREGHRMLQSSLAGTWYAADPGELGDQLDAFLREADTRPASDVRALILPHAGYRWSGPTAAWGVRRVQGRTFSRVIVMGPSHRVPLENVVSFPSETHYGTPLGEIELDVSFLARLRRHPEFRPVPEAHAAEHSVQIQLPLLQRALGRFRLVPLVVGHLDPDATRRVATILRGLLDADTLVVASSDFTHYGERFFYTPFRDDVPMKLRELDLGAYDTIAALDAEAFAAYVERTGATICGRRPIEILLHMLPADAKPELLRYVTSGEVSGDWDHCVSYLAISFETGWEGAVPETVAPDEAAAGLDATERALLVRLARATLRHALAHDAPPSPRALGFDVPESLRHPCGAFVTWRDEAGGLRGCIGHIHPRLPLHRAVMDTAVAAALRDRRFEAVQADELPGLRLTISVLTVPEAIASWRDIEPGRHGIVLEKGGRVATFLPRVGVEMGWDLEETLSRLAEKAGLAADDWREGASFLVFEAETFGE